EKDPSVDDFEILEDENGDPIESRSAELAFALVQVSVTTDDGDTGDLVIYLECRPLIPDVAVIVISQYMSPSGYEDELDRKDDIVDTLELGEDPGNDPQNSGNSNSDEQKMLDLLEATESDVDDYWTDFFDANGLDAYDAPTYVNFTSTVETGCGTAAPMEVGPFYCGPDKTVYFDVDWMLQELEPYGDFIISVVVAHEVGHHVQELLGIDKCDVTQCLNGFTSLQIELMADCFAGSWSQLAHERGQLAEGDVENAIVALSEFLGDPANTDSADASAHGPGSLRTWWFLRGYYEGASACFEQPDN
ncbi:MAG: neutral zinc metallopeptidase, partial [Thermomicrobiales bacterium]